MAIILGGVALSDHMVWEDKYGSEETVAQTAKRTLGGTPVILSQQLSYARPITLTATPTQGWLTLAQVQGVQALAEQAGAVVNLTIGAESYSVMFRHHEPPAFMADPLDQIGAQAPAGYYTATIKLLTV